MTFWLAPLLLVLLVAVADVWVYLDARRCAAAGSSVFIGIGPLTIDTPLAWLVTCLDLWIFFFPMYVVSRSRQP